VHVKSAPVSQGVYDIVVVLTVWKRNTTESILDMIRQQSVFDRGSIAVVLFQNGDHVDITSVVERWKQSSIWSPNKFDLLHVFYKVETGYYGRFLAPLSVLNQAQMRLSYCWTMTLFSVIDTSRTCFGLLAKGIWPREMDGSLMET